MMENDLMIILGLYDMIYSLNLGGFIFFHLLITYWKLDNETDPII